MFLSTAHNRFNSSGIESDSVLRCQKGILYTCRPVVSDILINAHKQKIVESF